MDGLNVFISSEMAIQEERNAADQAIRDLGHNPVRFENFPAFPNHPIKLCLEQIEESEIIILIIGENATEPTLKEYQKAFNIGRDILIFLKKCSRNSLVNTIIKEMQKRHTTKYFNNSKELEYEIKNAIQYLVRTRVREGQTRDNNEQEQAIKNDTENEISDEWNIESGHYCRLKIYMTRGQMLKGEVYETDGDDFDFYILSERQFNDYMTQGREFNAQKEYLDEGYYSIKWTAPRTGYFYLVGDVYQRKYRRDITLNLEIL